MANRFGFHTIDTPIIADNAITSAKIKDCAVTTSDLSDQRALSTTLADTPIAVDADSTMTWDGRDTIYAILTSGTGGFYKYSISGNSWSTVATLPQSAGAGVYLLHDGYDTIYILFGGSSTYFYKYSVSGNTFTALTAIPEAATYGASLVQASDDHIYASAGQTTTRLYRYSISGNSWTNMDVPEPGMPSITPLIFTGGNFIYGLTGGTPAYFQRYNIIRDLWERMADYPVSTWINRIGWYLGDDRIYFARRYATADVYAYNISTDTWTKVDDLPFTPDGYSSACTAGTNFIYLLKGNSTKTFYRRAEPARRRLFTGVPERTRHLLASQGGETSVTTTSTVEVSLSKALYIHIPYKNLAREGRVYFRVLVDLRNSTTETTTMRIKILSPSIPETYVAILQESGTSPHRVMTPWIAPETYGVSESDDWLLIWARGYVSGTSTGYYYGTSIAFYIDKK
jgi:hypothetical protein